jgi:Tfp pilus assembly protein PilV
MQKQIQARPARLATPVSTKESQPSQQLAGFTIVEIIITVVLIGLLVPALVSMITILGSINDRARDMSLIHALAENKVEGLRSINFTGLTNGTTDFTTELPATIATPRSAIYTISSTSASLKQVDVSISYNDHAQTRNLTYTTYIGELGVGQY